MLFGFGLQIARRCLTLTRETDGTDICFGFGWWVKGHWKKRTGWFHWSKTYYDGNWFGWRIGPFFYSRGPY